MKTLEKKTKNASRKKATFSELVGYFLEGKLTAYLMDGIKQTENVSSRNKAVYSRFFDYD